MHVTSWRAYAALPRQGRRHAVHPNPSLGRMNGRRNRLLTGRYPDRRFDDIGVWQGDYSYHGAR